MSRVATVPAPKESVAAVPAVTTVPNMGLMRPDGTRVQIKATMDAVQPLIRMGWRVEWVR